MLSQSLGGALYLFSTFFYRSNSSLGRCVKSADHAGRACAKTRNGVKNVVNIFILKYGTHPLGVRIFPPGLPLPSGDDGGK